MIAQSLGGMREDVGVEGAPAVLMNLPYHLDLFDLAVVSWGEVRRYFPV